MRGQSSLIAFLIGLIITLAVLIPTYYLLINYSKPTVKQGNFVQVVKNQINGGSVIIYYQAIPNSLVNTSSPYHNVTLLVLTPNGNFTLAGVFVNYDGIIVNITNEVGAVNMTATSSKYIGSLPKPLIYDFTFNRTINVSGVSIPVWDSPLYLQIEAYNQTVFAMVYPNESAIA